MITTFNQILFLNYQKYILFQDVEVPDTMKDMQATFSGIFGEKK